MQTFEQSFPVDFRKNEIGQIINLTQTGKFCQLISLPGGGKATILRLIATNKDLLKFHLGKKQPSTLFIYLNLLELPDFDQTQIEKFLVLALGEQNRPQKDPLLLTKQLNTVVAQLTSKFHLVLLFDHFDEIHFRLHRSFFQLLRGFKNAAKYRFAAVFATRRDLRELVDQERLREFYDFFIGNTVYLKIFDQIATNFLFSQLEQIFNKKISAKDKSKIIIQTAGHAKLTKNITEMLLRENISLKNDLLIKQPLVRAVLFELWLFLTAEEQQVLKQLARKETPQHDIALENLVKFDLIKGDSKNFTIPLLEEFVNITVPTLPPEKIVYNPNSREIKKGSSIISDLLSPQEYRLLKFFIENQAKIIKRNDLIEEVWPDAQVSEGISDEAIDQMVFRLRKKIEDQPNNPKHITTVKGQGLRFNP